MLNAQQAEAMACLKGIEHAARLACNTLLWKLMLSTWSVP
jgi:hypothetical protein